MKSFSVILPLIIFGSLAGLNFLASIISITYFKESTFKQVEWNAGVMMIISYIGIIHLINQENIADHLKNK